MLAKKFLVLALATAMVAGCGTNNTASTLPGDGTYDQPADDYGTGDDSYAPAPDASYAPIDDATDTATPALSYTLKGIVIEKDTRTPLAGAKITIGAQTMLTDAKGEFTISDIRDTQILVNVTADKHDPVANHKITFSDAKPTADLEFVLAKTASTGNDSVADGKLSHELSFGEGKFKSVSAMSVDGDIVYVLGVVDGFLFFNRNSVVAFDAESGEELLSFNKIGTFSRLPGDATSMKVENGDVMVSDGEFAWSFDNTGKLLSKTAGTRYSDIKEVTDDDNDVTYKVNGSGKIELTEGSTKTNEELDDVGTIRSIGLDSDNNLFVLDQTHKLIHKFSFND